MMVKLWTSIKAKKLPAELRIARATIIGCQHCSFVLKDFIELEMKLFHQVDFQEASGSDKRIIRFLNKNNDKLRDSDVTDVSSALWNFRFEQQKISNDFCLKEM